LAALAWAYCSTAMEFDHYDPVGVDELSRPRGA
jgi:hypothetical protein